MKILYSENGPDFGAASDGMLNDLKEAQFCLFGMNLMFFHFLIGMFAHIHMHL